MLAHHYKSAPLLQVLTEEREDPKQISMVSTPTSIQLDRWFGAPAYCHGDGTSAPQHSVDSLYTMIMQEVAYSSCDYLYTDDNSNEVRDEDPDECTVSIRRNITADDRTQIVDWCYDVIDLCQLDRETVAIAVHMVDRFMSNLCRLPSSGISPHFSYQEILYDRTKYQLLVVSALYIAIKVNERVIFSSEKLAAASQGMYSKESIEAMERIILACLQWRVIVPTAFQVGYVTLELLKAKLQESNSSVVDIRNWESIQEELRYQTEIAVRDYQLAVQRPSTIAISALINAIKMDPKKNEVESHLIFKALAEILEHVKSMTSEV